MKVLQAIRKTFSFTTSSIFIKRIHQLLQKVSQWKLEHIPRKDNLEADTVTKIAFERKVRLTIFYRKPIRYY